jgi:hypothetical protein
MFIVSKLIECTPVINSLALQYAEINAGSAATIFLGLLLAGSIWTIYYAL